MKNSNMSKWILNSALIIVGVIVVWGFTIIGSPSYNRKLSSDRIRIDDLRQISREVEQYFDRQKKLPEDLKDLNLLKSAYGSEVRTADPTSKKEYEYILKNSYSYELCASFELTSKEAEIENRTFDYYGNGRLNWDHGIGRSCFSLEIPVAMRQREVMNDELIKNFS